MNNLEESEHEKIRKRMQVMSEMVNRSLDHNSFPRRNAGLLYEHNPDLGCPRCGSGLKRKSGIIKKKQRWHCLVCRRFYFEREE